MNRILAIDPGTTRSGWCLIEQGGKILASGVADNDEALFALDSRFGFEAFSLDVLAIEMVASYGMAVGKETFRTVWWAGRFAERWRFIQGALPVEVYRADVKMHLCRSMRAKDANIRQALIDRYGPGKEAAIGRKASPGPLYGVTSHAWPALAVAVTVADQISSARAA